MSLKVPCLLLFGNANCAQQEIDINIAALKAFDEGEYAVALKTFEVCGMWGWTKGTGNRGFVEDIFQHGHDPCYSWRA
jgi:hypothetical protein